jgi:hypothetical protein
MASVDRTEAPSCGARNERKPNLHADPNAWMQAKGATFSDRPSAAASLIDFLDSLETELPPVGVPSYFAFEETSAELPRIKLSYVEAVNKSRS